MTSNKKSSPDVTGKPLAAPGLRSYRCKGQFGWIMIGAVDDADALSEARRSDPHATQERLQRWNGTAYVPCSSSQVVEPAIAMADDRYKSAICSALKGVYLFEHGARVDSASAQEDAVPRQFCVGNRRWVQCPGGLVDALAVFREQQQEIDNSGMRNSDLPEDWGIIADESGDITHRAVTAGIRQVTYLGRSGGPLEQAPLNIGDAGIAPAPVRPRQRG